MANISHFTQTVNGVSITYDIHDANAIPRSGGGVITGEQLGRDNNDSDIILCGGTSNTTGASIAIFGADYPNFKLGGGIRIGIQSYAHNMYMYADGTWTWDGQPVQIGSDARLKQQIAEIDDKLLDAWEDVTLCQFKYNDAVNEKGDNARLHTGYVVQQIQKACESHGVDISNYGLFCHEKYPEETEEVEVKNEDGTKTKERKVIREANEHYSLRYTEALIVECKYLRRCVERLVARIEKLEGNKEVEVTK
jgi:hypothetical protein